MVVAISAKDETDRVNARAQVQIDAAWARDILAGVMSPLAALERRLDSSGAGLIEQVQTVLNDRALRRIGSQVAASAEVPDRPLAATEDSGPAIRQAG